jgi:Uma2 family endonuclease
MTVRTKQIPKTATKQMPKVALPHRNGGELAWEIAHVFPPRGRWTENDFLALEPKLGNHLWLELVQGRIEVLPMPTELHQVILMFFLKALEAFTPANAPGLVLPSGIKVRIPSKGKPTFRLPDVVYLKRENYHLRGNDYWRGADLAMEVVSGDPKDQQRDVRDKVRDYAVARISEYWIIWPEKRLIRVYALKGKTYRLHGEFVSGQEATSVLLPGFAISVAELLAARE